MYIPPEIAAKVRAVIASINMTFQKGLAKGVKIDFGTDAGVYPHGLNAEEFVLMMKLGMRPIDALKAATSSDADFWTCPIAWERWKMANWPT